MLVVVLYAAQKVVDREKAVEIIEMEHWGKYAVHWRSLGEYQLAERGENNHRADRNVEYKKNGKQQYAKLSTKQTETYRIVKQKTKSEHFLDSYVVDFLNIASKNEIQEDPSWTRKIKRMQV